MATQLKHIDFTYAPPRPNIRVAFIAGAAAVAVNDATLPDATLEELAVRRDTEALIGKAHELLSFRMYDAFLRWGEGAVRANTQTTNDESERLSVLHVENVRRLAARDAQNMHDVLLKTYVLALEEAECPSFGPLQLNTGTTFTLDALVAGLQDDLAWISPLVAMTNDLSERAWQASGSGVAYWPSIGEAMSSAFTAARAAPVPPAPVGYNPYMRGPLIQWQKAYRHYEQAVADLAAIERDVRAPAEQRLQVLTGRLAADPDDGDLAAAVAKARDEFQEAYDRRDALLAEQNDAVDFLLKLTAPSASELAVKLQLFSDAYGWDLCNDPAVGQQMTIDARRFARHGALVQVDQPLIAAFNEYRSAFAACRVLPESASVADEDACFQRMDDPVEHMLSSKAATIEGVIAKLRVGFKAIGQDRYIDYAIVDPSLPAFRDGLAMNGTHERILWSAIEDLARIGGITLVGQSL